MPIGTFSAELKTSVPKPQKPEPVVQPASTPAQKELHICLVGRNMSIIQDYLCALYQNASAALQEEGLAFFTTELDTIRAVVSRKNALDMHFWEGNQYWSCRSEEQGVKTYSFCITPAGHQEQVLRLIIHCSCPSGPAGSVHSCDTVWLLADGVLFDDTVAADPYMDAIAAQIGTGQHRYLILSQVERIAYVGGKHAGQYAPDKQQILLDRARARFPAANSESSCIRVLPVQVYGGLVYLNRDDTGTPVLGNGNNGYFHSYEPKRCHFPLFHTLLQCLDSNAGPGSLDNSLTQGILAHFGKNMENPKEYPVNHGGDGE